MNSALGISTLRTHSAANALNEPTTPTPIDVLCGTGIERVNQPGNELFTVCVLKYVEQYKHAQTKKHKMLISKAALDELTELGVRFLKKHPSHQCWYVADQKVGRDRIGHFLRQHLDKNERKGFQLSPSMKSIVSVPNALRAGKVDSPATQAHPIIGFSSSPQSEILVSSRNDVGTKEKSKDGHIGGITFRSTYDVKVGSPPTVERLESRRIMSPSSPRFLLGSSSLDQNRVRSLEVRKTKNAIVLGVMPKSSVCSLHCANTKSEKLSSALVTKDDSCRLPVEMYKDECSTIDERTELMCGAINHYVSKSMGTTFVKAQSSFFPSEKPKVIGHVYLSNLPTKVSDDITLSDLTYTMECYSHDGLDPNSCNIDDFSDDVDLFDEADLAECLDWQAINYI